MAKTLLNFPQTDLMTEASRAILENEGVRDCEERALLVLSRIELAAVEADVDLAAKPFLKAVALLAAL